MRFLYSIGIFFYRAGIAAAACFMQKARRWQRGRRNEFAELEAAFAEPAHPVWFHCASLGEYEQAKPLIQKVKDENPQEKTLVTFFSPSGYEVRKNDPLPDYVFYLPTDFRHNARRFLHIVQPKAAVFIKYEFWFNYMAELEKSGIPFYYVSAIFRPSQYLFGPFGSWFLARLRAAGRIFVQNGESEKLLKKHGIPQAEVCGDTRFDRVCAIAGQDYELPEIREFKQDKKLIVAGSTWAPDEKVLREVFGPLRKEFKLIVAPHEINRKETVLTFFKSFTTVAYTECGTAALADAEVLVLDTVGMLSKVYKYSDISYVGGAFKTGLHNILEPGVFGRPVIFGPHYRHFNEAVQMVNIKGAFSIHDAHEMSAVVRRLAGDKAFYETVCRTVSGYVARNVGACDKICATLSKSLQP